MEAQLRLVTFSDTLILDLTYVSNSISHSTIPLSSACPGLFSFCTITVCICLPLPSFYGFIHLCIYVAINTFFLVSNQLFVYFYPRWPIKIILQPPTHCPCPTFSVIFPACLGFHPTSVFASTSSNWLWGPQGQGKGLSYLRLHLPISTTLFWEPSRLSWKGNVQNI